MAKSSNNDKEEEEEETGKPKKHVTRKKTVGSKKRVILGYRLTPVAYLASIIAILAVMGIRGSSVYFGSGHVMAVGLGYSSQKRSIGQRHLQTSQFVFNQLRIGRFGYGCRGDRILTVSYFHHSGIDCGNQFSQGVCMPMEFWVETRVGTLL
jgi:hypothetical protein